MQISKGFANQGEKHVVCKLHKSLYGLKQAPKQWNLKLTEALIDMGFLQFHYDYSLFTKRVGKEFFVILVYVDDLLVTDSNLNLIQQVRKDLQHRFKMKDLGELKYFLGIEFFRNTDGILINQRESMHLDLQGVNLHPLP